MRLYFYGDIGPHRDEPRGRAWGHHLYRIGEDGTYCHPEEGVSGAFFHKKPPTSHIPWSQIEAENTLPPTVPLREGDKEPGWGVGENQGQRVAAVHYRNGWTALALWDRSGDRRGNCVSVMFAEGTHGSENALQIFRERLPAIWERITRDGPIELWAWNPEPPTLGKRIEVPRVRFAVDVPTAERVDVLDVDAADTVEQSKNPGRLVSAVGGE